jgi:signal recognition particle subunit SRP68
MIPLFQAERCWAYAMQLRQDANKVPRKTHHSRQRLRKAAKYAELLERLASVEGKVDARTALEAQVGYMARSGVTVTRQKVSGTLRFILY